MKRIAFLLSAGISLHASSQQDTTELLPVEIRAVRAGAMAPFAKTNLGKQEIRKQNLGQDLPFLLNQTPSVVVHSDAGNGFGYTGIRIRGTDATRINVTLNGIPYNDAESQGTFFVDLPDFASSVSSIQIQRGVGTSTNGAGSFGATINLNTNEVNRTPYAEFNNSAGSFATVKNTIRAGTGLLKGHYTADLRLSRLSSDGYIDRAFSNLRSLYFSTAYLSARTDLRLNIFTGREKTYQAWYGVSEADLKNNRTVNYAGMDRPGSPYDNETDNYRQDHYQLFFTRRFTPALSFNTALFLTRGIGYYEQYKAGQRYSRYNMPGQIVGTDSFTHTDLVRQLWLDNYFYGNIYSLQYNRGATSLIAGGSLTQYDGAHYGEVIWAERGITGNPRWYENDARKNDINTYVKAEHRRPGGLLFFADLQYRHVDYTIDGFRDHPGLSVDSRFDFFNPKAGLSYHRGKWLAYASYSIAGKEPNRSDFEAGETQQPRAERLHDLELGSEFKAKGFAASANIYYMRYRDQLVLTGMINDVGAYTRTNIPNSYRAGIELSGAAEISRALRLSANLTLSRNRVENFTEFIDDYDNNIQVMNIYRKADIAFSPAVIAGGTLTVIPARQFSLDFINKYVGKQYLDNTSNENRKLDPFYVADMRAAWSFTYRWLKNTELIFQVNNIFNTMYEPNGYTFSYIYNSELVTENFYFPMAGRNWMAGLNIRL